MQVDLLLPLIGAQTLAVDDVMLVLEGRLSVSSKNGTVTAGPGEADQILLERGTAALKERRWITARQYFSELLESYPQSPLRAEAKLGVGDSYLGENNSASFVYAQNEYREFLAFYPTNPRADYAQMQLGMVHYNQMLNPQRDQSSTKSTSPRARSGVIMGVKPSRSSNSSAYCCRAISSSAASFFKK